MRIFGFLDQRNFTIYLDTSGEALFKRGWREETGDAPLRENLAAGMLRVSGWKPGVPLFDPMCGSGTILIEAAQMVQGIPPGARRRPSGPGDAGTHRTRGCMHCWSMGPFSSHTARCLRITRSWCGM